ncbi:MAG: J domain-containing protein [Leptolyngbyaceae cyanobacterium T60_A2020_046]|nr:J domain-containing protein [Leptolyngbyaceae cyanobacterium T60_A2020_046]
MQNFRNYFELLRVSQDASMEDIKRSYRQLARKYHPDLNPGDKEAEERFKMLGEAYEVLSDPEKRAQYEEYSRFWKQKGFAARAGSTLGRFSFGNIDFGEFRDFNTFVDQLLNRRRESATATARREAPTPPPPSASRSRPRETAASRSPNRRDAEANLTIPLERAYAGGEERIRLEDGRSLEVSMPPGMVTGQRIRLKGQGIGGGNLYLRIEVEPHPVFQVRENDVLCRVPVTPTEAVLGGTITVPTLDGPAPLSLPAGVQAGARLRLPGKGYPVGRDRRGDQIVEIDIAVPKQVSDRERALYQQLRQIETFAPRTTLLSP